jgi:pyruvate dehydrogenase complex dehydrogenase (E1) component
MDIVRGAGDITDHVTILATGISVHDAIAAADRLWNEEKVRARVLNVSCIRPFDAASVIQAALESVHLIVVEDHHSEGGIASRVADVIADFQLPATLRRLGTNHYFPSGSAEDLKFIAGLDVESIVQAALDEAKGEARGGEDAFVTVIHSLIENTRKSAHRQSAQAFVDRLLTQEGYMEALRDKWKKREVPASKLPGNDELKKRLST